jgi:hypothetical protein
MAREDRAGITWSHWYLNISLICQAGLCPVCGLKDVCPNSSRMSQSKRIKFPLFELSDLRFDPTCVVLVRGERASGVSTVFNLLFQSPVRSVNEEPLFAKITELQQVKNESSPPHEIEFRHEALSDLFPHSLNKAISYQFVDCGNLTDDWYTASTRLPLIAHLFQVPALDKVLWRGHLRGE